MTEQLNWTKGPSVEAWHAAVHGVKKSQMWLSSRTTATIDEWMNKIWYIHMHTYTHTDTRTNIYIMEYYSAIKRDEILPFAPTWMDLESRVRESDSRLCLTLHPWTVVHQAPLSMGFPRQEYWSGGAISFSRESSQAKDQTWVSHMAGRFFSIRATRH